MAAYALSLATRPRDENSETEGLDDFRAWQLWTRAISQHYGPGSSYLDVTRSIDVALWFALNCVQTVEIVHVFGDPGPIGAANDVLVRHPMHFYNPCAQGWLYVFDVPSQSGQLTLEHGGLVDCATAPAPFSDSARMGVQKSCLITAHSTDNGGDLISFLACPPVKVARPVDEWPLRNTRTVDMFPPPASDGWYARLISIPWTKQANTATEMIQPLPLARVTLYVPDQQHTADVLDRLILLPHYALLPTLCQMVPEVTAPHPVFEAHRIEDATAIQVYIPLFLVTPPLDSGLWNPGLLVSGIADEVSTISPAGTDAGTATLRNVLVEFSPLEYPWWDTVENDEPVDFLRAAWLIRDGQEFILTLFYQSLPGDSRITGIGNFAARLDQDTNRLVFRVLGEESGTSTALGGVPVLLKNIYLVLDLLRELSPAPKVRAYPLIDSEVRQGEHEYWLEAFGATRRLIRGRESSTGRTWHVISHTGLDDPFSREANRTALLRIRAPARFEDVDPNSLMDQLRRTGAGGAACAEAPSA